MTLPLIPAALNRAWCFFATHHSGQEDAEYPVRGTDRLTAVTLEQRVAIEATA